MDQDQRIARIFGVLYLITFITSIPALGLHQSVLDNPAGYISGGGKDNLIYLGVLLELFLTSSASSASERTLRTRRISPCRSPR